MTTSTTSKRPYRTRKNAKVPANGQSQVQSLSRALGLLERLSETDVGMNLSELSGSVGLAPSTTHRLLNTLLSMEFVEFDEQLGIWSVGVNTFTIGNAYLKKRNFVAQARPHMRDLMLESGETCNLAILEADSVIFISQVECLETMRMVVRLGSRGPIHATGVGKSLVANWSEDEVLELLQRVGMTSLTSNTILSPTDFLDELAKIREQGYSVDNEEQKEGLTCVAANVYDEYGEPICAVSISGPSVRVTKDRLPQLCGLVTAKARVITEAIGGRLP